MRALVLDAFGAMSVHEVDRPTPGVGQVLVGVAATGICGPDIHGFAGTNRRRWPGRIMGHESSGVIAALGPGTDDEEIEVGDAVTFNPVVVPDELIELFASREQHASEKPVIGVNPEWPAAFADYVVVPARNVVRLRYGVPIETARLLSLLLSHCTRSHGRACGPRTTCLSSVADRSASPSWSRCACVESMSRRRDQPFHDFP